MKLHRVSLRGMSGTAYGVSYVVAGNSDEAYQKVRSWLDDHDYGFRHERAMDSVDLLADTDHYNDTGTMLFL